MALRIFETVFVENFRAHGDPCQLLRHVGIVVPGEEIQGQLSIAAIGQKRFRIERNWAAHHRAADLERRIVGLDRLGRGLIQLEVLLLRCPPTSLSVSGSFQISKYLML